MRAIAKRFSKPQIGFIVFVAGVASLFLPHFSGWLDVVFPAIAQYMLLPYLFWGIFFSVAFFLLLLHLLSLFFLKSSGRAKIIATSLLAGLIVLFLGIYPNFSTEKYLGSKQRVSFFAVGGQTRIAWAGGSEIIKNDALALLSQQTDEKGYVSRELWADSLKRLGVYWIRMDRETESVIVYIPRTELFDAAQFGYLINNGETPEPEALKSRGYRLWKLDEGLYFFQLW
jgi:hypothetical protein